MKNLWLVWVLTLGIKLLLAAVIPLSTDEAYYWVWSVRPQLSYFDHPPSVAWLFYLGHAFESIGNAVRWPAVILGHCTLLVWIFIWRLLNPSADNTKVSWWLSLVLCSPLLGFGSLIITPDVPVLFFWSTSLLFVLRILKSQKSSDYALLGASLGLGFCSKYHIVLVVPILVAFVLFEKKWKEIDFKKASYAILLGLLFSSPVLIWNLQNDFESFRFQLKHGLGRPNYEFYWTWTYVLGQILLIFPTVVWAACRARLQGNARILYYFGWGPLLFFFLSSFKALVEANWPIVAYPAFFAIAVFGAKNFRPFLIANAIWVSIFIIIFSHAVKPWIPSAPEKLMELSDFEPLIEKRRQYEPLYASTYQMASWVWYYTKIPTFKLHGMSRRDIFDTFPEGTPKNFPIYIAMRRDDTLPPWVTEKGSPHQVTEIESLENDLVIVRVDP